MDSVRTCEVCGAEFTCNEYQQTKKFCSVECRKVANKNNAKRFWDANKDEINRQQRERRKIKKKKSNSELLRINELALKEGLSYGQYVAKYRV